MESLDLAGIPVVSVQGPQGGYRIKSGYRMDRQLLTVDDLFDIVTALSGIAASLGNRRIGATAEKMRSLLPQHDTGLFAESSRKLFIDFSMPGGPNCRPELLQTVERSVDEGRLLRLTYTNRRLGSAERIQEPMTVVFKWRSWYLFAYCRLREGYRLFRLSRIRNPELLAERFHRRGMTAEEYEAGPGAWDGLRRAGRRHRGCA